MENIKHPTEILTEAEINIINSNIICSIAIFALSIIIFCFKHFYFCAIFALSIAMFALSKLTHQPIPSWLLSY